MQNELRDQVDKLRALLIVADANPALELDPSEGLRDLQVTIDRLRAHLWMLLKTQDESAEQAFVVRMRVRRARETCEGILADLDEGTVTAGTPGLPVLHATLRELSRALEEDLQ
jgi:hypothetical protein